MTTLPVLLEESEEFILKPEHIQSTRYDVEGHLEALVQWQDLSDREKTWLRVKDIARDYLSFEFEDKLSLTEESNDKSWRVYYRKKSRGEKISGVVMRVRD